MSERSTESLLRGLTRELPPVRPLPRLRTVLLAMLGVFGLGVVGHAMLGGALPFASAGPSWSDPVFLTLLAGLALTAGGASAAALAGSVPGRGAAATTARAVALLGAVTASSAGLWNLMRADAGGAAAGLAGSLPCAGRAGALGLLPALLLCVFLARAVERRPLLGAGLACVGGITLGAAFVHASCADGQPLHVLMGHWAAPFALALVLALPLSLVLRQRSRRS